MITEEARFNFVLLKHIVYILLFVLLNSAAFAGNSDKENGAASKGTTSSRVIVGKVTDRSGESIAGAKILIAETGETVFSDLDGNFKLSVKTDKVYSITINTIGFQPLEVKSSGLSTFTDLSLESL